MLENIRRRCLVPLLIERSGGSEFPRWCLFCEGRRISLFVHALMDTVVAMEEVFRISKLVIVFSPCLLLEGIKADLRAGMALNGHWSSLCAAVRLLRDRDIGTSRFCLVLDS